MISASWLLHMLLQAVRGANRFQLETFLGIAIAAFQPLFVVHVHITYHQSPHKVTKILELLIESFDCGSLTAVRPAIPNTEQQWPRVCVQSMP